MEMAIQQKKRLLEHDVYAGYLGSVGVSGVGDEVGPLDIKIRLKLRR